MADDEYMPEPDPDPPPARAQRADRRRADERYDDEYDDPDEHYRPRGRDVKFDEDGNEITSNDTLLALFAHLGLIVGGFLVPLIIFLVSRHKSPYVVRHAKAALNYAITHLVIVFGWIAVAALIGLVIYLASQNGIAGFFTGYILAIVGSGLAGLAAIIFAVMGAVAAGSGKPYRYPICITFIG
jgi:uncharacterized Tic20 family protein